MDKSTSFDKQTAVNSRTSSIKDLSTSHSSIKSNKSVDNQTQNAVVTKSVSLKSEKAVQLPKCTDKKLHHQDGTPKIPHKFIANWRQACDRTRDRTRELLKRWKTLPEFEGVENIADMSKQKGVETPGDKTGWSVHVWTTWVDRFSVDSASEEQEDHNQMMITLTTVQRDKFSHFFTYLLDHDRDDIVGNQDFEAFSEKLRHFADWSPNSAEFHILREVQRGFIDTFLDYPDDNHHLGLQMNDGRFISLEVWLHRWSRLVHGAKRLSDFPLWLQYFVKILFQVINRSGSGIISRDELSAFYSSVLGLDTVKVGEILDQAYKAMTSNGDHQLGYYAYKLCFANYLMARYPNGPGQFVFGIEQSNSQILFPVDYSALNTSPSDLEHYTPDKQTNRHSVVV
ncbi:hypothetical protein CBL_13752 [Carabus blaptoides fortunei]